MKFRWSVAVPQPAAVGRIVGELNISPLLAQCLLNRGLAEPQVISRFLQPRLKELSDPFLLPNMQTAVARLALARERREKIVIFGDYDVDGVTSTAILFEVLGRLGWAPAWYLPHRLDEGYGLSREGVENCLRKCPASLVLAVDCGSTSVEAIAELQARGIDVIVLDHHQVSDPAPPAVAIVNPCLRKCDGASDGVQHLCSAGLSFKLAHALVKAGRNAGWPEAKDFDLRPLLDLVALGTIADVVPLTGENRILVATGLERLNQTARPGLMALKRVAQSPGQLCTGDVAFQLSPRLNAAGRMETAEQALELLLAADHSRAMHLAGELDMRNRERQKLERGILAEAVAQIRQEFDPARDFVIVAGNGHWHIGVVGIVAARILQQFYRPTIILGGDEPQWRGSGRSVPGFDLAEAMRHCSELLVRHGGHAMAAGVTLAPENVAEFRRRLNSLAREKLRLEELQPPLNLDGEVKLNEVTLEALGALDQLRPSGQGNPSVQFMVGNVRHQRQPQRLGVDKQHVKMWVTDGRTVHQAVWWGAANEPLPVESFDLAFAPTLNEYNGNRMVQLKVLDWRPAAGAPRP